MRYNYPVLARILKDVDQSQTVQIFNILKDTYNSNFKYFILNRHLRIFLEKNEVKDKKNVSQINQQIFSKCLKLRFTHELTMSVQS